MVKAETASPLVVEISFPRSGTKLFAIDWNCLAADKSEIHSMRKNENAQVSDVTDTCWIDDTQMIQYKLQCDYTINLYFYNICLLPLPLPPG